MTTLLALLLSTSLLQPRERAVLVYPKERAWFRPLFYTHHQRELQKRLGVRYDVEIHEHVGSDDALFGIDVRGAKLLVLSAHGDPYAMFFASRSRRTLDATDAPRLRRFLAQLDRDAVIVLQSCQTGRGFAHLVKEAAGGRRVVAAKGEIPAGGLEILSLWPFEVKITCSGDSDCTIRL